jgi:predicted dehydrogenase
VAGITDINHERATEVAHDWGIPEIYTDVVSAAKAHGTDAVYDIAVPPAAITDILSDLPDNSAVLIQKPMGLNQAHARTIRDLCREKNLTAAVNFQLRFSPMMMAARQAIEANMIGDLLEIEVHVNIYTPWHLFPFHIPMERVEIAVHSIHYLDTIRALAGNPKGVFARSLPDPRVPDLAQTRTSVLLDYGDRLRGLMSINHNHQCGRPFQSAWFRLEGSTGTLMVKLGVCFAYPDGEPDELWFCRNGGEWEQIPLTGSWFIDAFMGPIRNLQRVISGEDSTLFSGVEDAYETMALVEACFRASEKPSEPIELD